MQKNIFNKYVGALIAITVYCSCSNDDPNNIEGEWKLTSITTECVEPNLSEETETLMSNGLCCVSLSSTDTNDTFAITYTQLICEQLTFQDNELEVISEVGSERDTSYFSYQQNGEDVEVCTAFNQCINYTFSNNEVNLIFDIATITGSSCERIFSYKR